MKRTAETVYLQSMVQEAYDKSESIRERVQLRKKMKKIPDHDFKNCLPISVVVALGVYNHPRFIIFASVPLFFWFQRGIAVNSSLVPFAVFHFRMLLLVPGEAALNHCKEPFSSENLASRRLRRHLVNDVTGGLVVLRRADPRQAVESGNVVVRLEMHALRPAHAGGRRGDGDVPGGVVFGLLHLLQPRSHVRTFE